MDNVLVIGSAIPDISIELDQLPTSGEDIEAKKETCSIGGCALNVICVLKAFKTPYTAFLPIGKGFYGNMVHSELEKLGIESCLRPNEGDNGHCYAFIEKTGERSFVTLSGIEAAFKKEWFSQLQNKKFSYTYISGYSLLGNSGNNILDYLETALETKVIFAPGPRIDIIDRLLMDRIYRLSPLIHLNKEELQKITGCDHVASGLQHLHGKTKGPVIVTLGSQGASYICENTVSSVPGEKVSVINTSGAGDAHVGAVIVGLIQKRPLSELVQHANTVSAKVVSQEDTKY